MTQRWLHDPDCPLLGFPDPSYDGYQCEMCVVIHRVRAQYGDIRNTPGGQ